MNETIADIVAQMRSDAEAYHDAWLNDPNENPQAENAQSQRCIDMCDGCFNAIKNRVDSVDAMKKGAKA
jgi:hypothetical protein